jgi:hypothetical protein
MNANRTKETVHLRRHTSTLNPGAVLSGFGLLLAILALWPISLGQVREYTFLTLAALFVIRSSNWVRVENDQSAINGDVETRWATPTHFVFL